MKLIEEIELNTRNLSKDFDKTLFENLRFPSNHYQTHKEIAKKLSDKSPYTITIIHDPLKAELMNKKEYVKKERREISSKYIELLFDCFKNEFGEHRSQDIYHKWLEKYRNKWNKGDKYKDIDEYIKVIELEPRYKKDILKKFKNHKKFRNNFLDQEYSGKCKNRNGDNICYCSRLEDTSEGCTFYISGPEKGGCVNPEQKCTYQGSGPDDPDNGKEGVCVTREQINIDTLEKERTCVCNELAVCGDERVDKDQGEKCDPPGLPTDGCEDTGRSCSEDCRRCIPTPRPSPPIF